MRKILLTLLTTLLCSVTAWAANANISTASSPTGSAGSFYFIADGTAVTAIAGAGGHAVSYNSGSKITVQGKPEKKVATITFTIASGVTITSFTVNGTKNNNTTYDLNGTPVSTFGTAITGLSITSSMTFTLTCTDGTSSSSNRNTTITSIDLVYSTSGGSTYTVTYNGNGNTGGTAPSDASSPYAAGSNVTVLDNTGSLVKTGYTFDGWNTADDGSGTNYAVGATISSIAANTTLYAKWTCAATVPGNISKGSACAGEDLTLTSAGSPETGDTWYWQASSSGTATTNSGATYDVSSAGTYYIRSYNGTCWSAAKSVTVAAGDWTSPTISGASSVTVGNTITLTGSPSGGSWESSDETKATVNPSGVVSGVAIGNTNITYSKDGCTSDNHAVTVSAACTDPGLTITLN